MLVSPLTTENGYVTQWPKLVIPLPVAGSGHGLTSWSWLSSNRMTSSKTMKLQIDYWAIKCYRCGIYHAAVITTANPFPVCYCLWCVVLLWIFE